jgi:DNA invertase Pin-like site-specific DNA recombinase
MRQRKHRLQPREKRVLSSEWVNTELPLQASVGIYARQSTPMQVKVHSNSTEMQTEDLVEFARRLGWDDDKIIVFTQDLGLSGRLRIDEREGLRTLVSRIEDGTIKAVIVFLEDRLFRDETQVQVNTFISICKRYGVLVITPQMTYNFNNRFHVKEFRWKCEAAADYITDYVMARLVGGKYKVSERGEYDGRGIPAGYVLDRREWLVSDGVKVKNPGYRKYMIYEPHAEVVRWLFHRYMMLGGNLSRLCREIKEKPFLFPEFSSDIDPRTVSRLTLKRVGGGYHITRKGLISLLTNVSYLGWWLHQGEVKDKHNHPAIVDEELFWYAFNRLSPYTLDGKQNEIKKQYARYHQVHIVREALLKNIITSELLGPVYVVPHKKLFYGIYEKDLGLVVQYRSAIAVADLDAIYVDRLLYHLSRTTDFLHYREYVEQERQLFEREIVSVQAQIEEIDSQCEGIMMSLKKPSLSSKLRESLEQEYDRLQMQRAELEAKLAMERKSGRARELLEYHTLVEKLAPHWDSLLFADRQMLVEALTEQVYLDLMTPHWMRLVVQWRDREWGREIGLIWRMYGSSPDWTEQENDVLRKHYATADRASLLTLLPDRSWRGILFQAHLLKLRRSKQSINNSPIPETLTYRDWQFMQERGIEFEASWGLIKVIWLDDM